MITYLFIKLALYLSSDQSNINSIKVLREHLLRTTSDIFTDD